MHLNTLKIPIRYTYIYRKMLGSLYENTKYFLNRNLQYYSLFRKFLTLFNVGEQLLNIFLITDNVAFSRMCPWDTDGVLLEYNIKGHISRMVKVTQSKLAFDLNFLVISIMYKFNNICLRLKLEKRNLF